MHTFKSLDEFKAKLKKIADKEFVQSMRKGDTGIGYTLESLLDIKENNVPLADLGEIELKAYRKDSCSMLTLFTCEPKPAGGERDKMLLNQFGYSSEKKGRAKELYCTINASRFNNQSLKLCVEKNVIRVTSDKKNMNVYWDFESLGERFDKKIQKLIVVEAEAMFEDDSERFHFSNAYLLEGFNFVSFCKLVSTDAITVDFRMHLRTKGTVRNHGTAFRVHKRRLIDCYQTKVKLI